ncbi:MAG: hypothetical protein HC785_26875 [Calothrix sp. CSU_2_0]|nr:hypothetical protein [Calothrix sp. CSU_2_0]
MCDHEVTHSEYRNSFLGNLGKAEKSRFETILVSQQFLRNLGKVEKSMFGTIVRSRMLLALPEASDSF